MDKTASSSSYQGLLNPLRGLVLLLGNLFLYVYKRSGSSGLTRRLVIRFFGFDRTKVVWDTRHNIRKFDDRVRYVGEIWPTTIFKDRSFDRRNNPGLEGYREIYAHRAKEAFIFYDAEVSSITGMVSIDRRKYFSDGVIGRNSPEAFTQLPLPRFRFKGRVYVANERNFWHFITEDLVNAMRLQQEGFEFTVLLPGMAKWSADLFGLFTPELSVVRAPAMATICAPEVLSVTKENHDSYIHPDSIRLLASAFRTVGCGKEGGGDRIYISRRLASTRRPVNEAEIETNLERRGFRCVSTETLGREERFALFRGASIVVATHGAGLTNALGMAEGGTLIEIFDPRHVNFCYLSMASKIGLNYVSLFQKVEGEEGVINWPVLSRSLARLGVK